MNHIGVRADEQRDVDTVAKFLSGHGVAARFGTPRHRPEFAEGEGQTYYQVMFTFPDNTLFEVVYIGPQSRHSFRALSLRDTTEKLGVADRAFPTTRKVPLMRAIRVHEYGGPEAMRLEELPTPKPGPGQALVRVEAAGVNYIDVYHRTGLYKVPLPVTLGLGGAGGRSRRRRRLDLRVGRPRRVDGQPSAATPSTPSCRPSGWCRCPTGVSAKQGAAAMLQGMTAHYLAHSTYPLKRGRHVPRARGGRRRRAAALPDGEDARRARHRHGRRPRRRRSSRARRAPTTSSSTRRQDFEAEVKRLTGGAGVQVVYDSVGKTTFDKSLNCLGRGAHGALRRVERAGRRRSIRRSTPRARSSSRVRPWTTTSRPARS